MSTKVSQVMHEGVEWVAPDTSISDIAKMMRDKDIGAVPVGKDDKLVGMVTDRDIAIRGLADGDDPASLTAGDVMSEPIVYCRADQPIEEAIRIMEAQQVRRLPVINAKKRMVGMFSLGDLSHSGHPDLTIEVVEAVTQHHG